MSYFEFQSRKFNSFYSLPHIASQIQPSYNHHFHQKSTFIEIINNYTIIITPLNEKENENQNNIYPFSSIKSIKTLACLVV